jgi:hypothetical protein
MMLQTVAEGTATELRDIPDLAARPEPPSSATTHTRMVVRRLVGDIAFATLVVGGDTSAPAIKVSGDFARRTRGLITAFQRARSRPDRGDSTAVFAP